MISSNNTDTKEWLPRKDAIRFLGVKPATFANYIYKKKIPEYAIKHAPNKKNAFFKKSVLMGLEN